MKDLVYGIACVVFWSIVLMALATASATALYYIYNPV